MTRLATLRTRLQSLRLARLAVRWGSAAALVWTAMVIGWLLAWWIDWSLSLGLAGRGLLLIAWAAAIAAVVHRKAWREVSQTESLEDVALVVEREHAIDSDLIAALQFEDARAAGWGSSRLSTAVVDYVSEFSQTLDVYRGFRWGTLPRRGAAAASLTLFFLILMLAWPGHAAAFWNRFWLGSDRYPTRTQILELQINGQMVDVHRPEIARLAVPQDGDLRIAVLLAGEIPATAAVAVQGLSSRERGQWLLEAAGDAGDEPRFSYLAPRLSESTRLTIRAGDAESDPIDIDIVPLPVVDLQWTANPPVYARGGAVASVAAGARHFAALPGSGLELTVLGINKPLQTVELLLIDPMSATDQSLPLVAKPGGEQGGGSDSDGRVWQLPDGHPLSEFRTPLRYELRVVDADGLQPQPLIQGEIRVQADRLPRVAAAVVSRRVLPSAAPKITYGATDDFGLKEIRCQIDIVPVDGGSRSESRTFWTLTGPEAQRSVRGDAVLNLAPYKLAKGDEVQVTVQAADDRGEFPPGVGLSEVLIFEVTDRNGILESLLEIDQQSAKQLDEIIERELGIGRTSR